MSKTYIDKVTGLMVEANDREQGFNLIKSYATEHRLFGSKGENQVHLKNIKREL